MPQPEFDQNLNYRRYVELLRQLHLAMSVDPADEARADEIRDQMDSPWRGMSPTEIERVQGLSADLYSLEAKEDRPAEPLTEEGRALCIDFRRDFDLMQWDQTLATLRKAARYYRLSDVSLARGRIWRGLRDPETAILFYEHAAALAHEYPADGSRLAKEIK